VFFVTKLLVNAVLEVVERHPVPQNRRIVSDETVRFVGKKTRDKYPGPLRRIIVDLGDGETLALLTNNFHLGASTIATIYKDRWQIELFFKALKQNLRIKTFVGTSANALKIQIWTALIAILLLKYMQMKARFGLSLSNLVALLRMNLFVYRDLWDWVNNPFSGPPREPSPVQMNFSFN
jgi:IS4 transposase